jgi:hypothetical protein
VIVTKECISKKSLSENLPLPLFAKEGFKPSLWQREVRRDFINIVFILMTLLVSEKPVKTEKPVRCKKGGFR